MSYNLVEFFSHLCREYDITAAYHATFWLHAIVQILIEKKTTLKYFEEFLMPSLFIIHFELSKNEIKNFVSYTS